MSKQWFENSKLWKGISPFIFSEGSFSAARQELKDLLFLLQPLIQSESQEGVQALDLGSGPGRHTLPLLDFGYAVDAVDLNKSYLEELTNRAGSNSESLKILHQDMRVALLENRYDLAICLFTSFGYFEDWDDNLKLLKNIFSSLKDGAYFVLEVTSPSNFICDDKGMGNRRRQISADDSLVEVWKVTSVASHRRVQNDWTFMTKGKTQRFQFQHWLFTKKDLEQLLEEAGFRSSLFYSTYKGHAYSPESESIIVLAQK